MAALKAELASLRAQLHTHVSNERAVNEHGHVHRSRGPGTDLAAEQPNEAPRVIGAAAMSMSHLRDTSPEVAAAIERHGASLEHHYIVGLRGHATEKHVERVKSHARATARAKHGKEEGHVEVTRSFSHALRGFSARLTPEVRAELTAHEDVSFVVPDRVLMPAQSTSDPFFPTATPAPDWTTAEAARPLMRSPPWAANLSAWHLDQLDGSKPLDGKYHRGTVDGTNVDIYVLDTGIVANHTEFGSRVVRLFDVDSAMYSSSSEHWAAECSTQSHGTAVASVRTHSVFPAAGMN
eukprot:tig00020816_g14170.t1